MAQGPPYPTDAEYHREQLHSHSCVPACVCIILSRLGRPTGEEALLEGLISSGLKEPDRWSDVLDAGTALDWETIPMDPDEPSSLLYLRARLAEPRWIVSSMSSRHLMALTVAIDPAPKSRFGPLATKPYNEFHAVVMTRADRSHLYYLDPYYPRDYQPFKITDDDFVGAWQGRIAISAPCLDERPAAARACPWHHRRATKSGAMTIHRS